MRIPKVTFAVILLPVTLLAQSNKTQPQLGKSMVKEVLAAMTLQEKANIKMVGISSDHFDV